MASSSGASSESSCLRNSSSEEDLQQIMDQRKRKKMQSNRESARRSRMRKQKHLDDLMNLMGQLKKENNEILNSLNITTQLYLNFEAENSILRAQVSEINQRLESLNEIINYVNFNNGVFETDDYFINPWSSFHVNQQPIMDMAMY